MPEDWSPYAYTNDPMRFYRAKRDAARRSVTSRYNILGFISSGTYGRVYKAHATEDNTKMYAIKKFKPDKEGDVTTYTGLSQSAIREIAVSQPL
jgi:cyclin-dependent kinase 8/11